MYVFVLVLMLYIPFLYCVTYIIQYCTTYPVLNFSHSLTTHVLTHPRMKLLLTPPRIVSEHQQCHASTPYIL